MNQQAENSLCSCCSGKDFQDCCAPLISGAEKASTAEQLMRSRYSAYAHGNVDYLLETTHPSTRKFHSREGIGEWAAENEWLKLEILSATEKKVEFKAFFRDQSSMLQVHHEKSDFIQENGTWYFVDGISG